MNNWRYSTRTELERQLTIIRVLLAIVLAVLTILVVVVSVFIASTTHALAADLTDENRQSITLSAITLNPSEIGAQRLIEAYDTVAAEEPEEEHEWITFVATAYCPNSCCCGKWSEIAYKATASGAGAVEGRTIAMDEAYPFGTRVYIEGLGERVCEDRGSAIVGNHIDLYYESHEDACEWGMRTVRGYIIKEN